MVLFNPVIQWVAGLKDSGCLANPPCLFSDGLHVSNIYLLQEVESAPNRVKDNAKLFLSWKQGIAWIYCFFLLLAVGLMGRR